MIICNLSRILDAKNLKISDLHRLTGISRPTLTNLNNNLSKGVNFETLDLLCIHLNINISDLLEYATINIIDVVIKKVATNEYKFYIDINIGNKRTDITVKGLLNTIKGFNNICIYFFYDFEKCEKIVPYFDLPDFFSVISDRLLVESKKDILKNIDYIKEYNLNAPSIEWSYEYFDKI